MKCRAMLSPLRPENCHVPNLSTLENIDPFIFSSFTAKNLAHEINQVMSVRLKRKDIPSYIALVGLATVEQITIWMSDDLCDQRTESS